MSGAPDNRAAQTSLTLTLSPLGAREPNNGKISTLLAVCRGTQHNTKYVGGNDDSLLSRIERMANYRDQIRAQGGGGRRLRN